jgi:NADH:ubiquinone oxidoreductase subunit 5 (subunit L)/multisubunit Na+/H+ antiporter MnhA subunit
MVRNRIGDFGLSIAIFIIYSTFGSVDYSIVFSSVPAIKDITVPFCLNINIIDFMSKCSKKNNNYLI